MFTPTLITALSLAAAAMAAPMEKRALTGTNPGSIFSFGDAATERQVFNTVGSCGLSTFFPGVVPASVPLVAMPASVMNSHGSAQHNDLCGKIITMTDVARGITRQAAIADTNVSDEHSIDMTIDLWTAFGQPANDGSIIPALNWSIDTSGSGGNPGNPGSGSCKQHYTVVSGDFCFAIWTKFGLTESKFRSLNPSLDSACDIFPGQSLCVA